MSRFAVGVTASLVAIICLSGLASAQKFGFIDSDKIQSSYKEWAKAQEQFNTEMKAWEDEAAKMDQELRTMSEDYDKQKLILSADKKVEKEAAIAAKEQALQSYTRDISGPGGRAERRMKELVQPLYDKITGAIEKVAIANNYDFVFNSAGLAYARKELDITDKVIEMLESGE
jgi:outer membrane protein